MALKKRENIRVEIYGIFCYNNLVMFLQLNRLHQRINKWGAFYAIKKH
jgi:hypothetical protein